ncbi:MAG: secretin N-terminal domain-containing protein, partial [Deltaproteobacteria bacterium]
MILKAVVLLTVLMSFLPVWAQESPPKTPAITPVITPSPPPVQTQPLPMSKVPSPDMSPQSTMPPQPVMPPGSPLPAKEDQMMASPAAMPPQASQPLTPQQKTTGSGGQVTLNFDDADVYEVIQTIFGQVLRVNYVVDPRVKGRVTFRSIAPVAHKNVLPVMEVILRLNNIAVVEESNLYRIIPIGDIAKEPAHVQLGRDSKSIPSTGKALLQVVPIRYMQSSDVVKLIAPFMSANAVIIDVPKSNMIIMVDTDANVKRLLQLVEIFDNEQQKKRGPQVFVYHVQNSKAKEIAAQLQQIFLTGKSSGEKVATVTTAPQSQSMSVPPSVQPTFRTPSDGEALVSDITRIFFDETLNAVIVLATPEDYEIIKGAIVKIDLAPRQVMIEGMIASVVLTDNLSLGLAYSIKTNVFGLASTIALNPASLDPTKIPGTGLSMVGVDSGGAIRAVISALALQSKAKLLAAPHILVSDNREARIQVGQQVPLVTSETFGSSTIAPQRTIQYKDIGIILKVKPQVNE